MKRFAVSLIFIFSFVSSHSVFAQTSDEQIAVQYYSNREYEKAAELFEKLYEKRPDSYFYSYLLQSYVELKDFKSAEKLVKKQIKRFSNLPRYKVDLGYIYESSNQPSKAIKEYEEAIKNSPAEPFYISDLANSFISRRQYDYAIQTYQNGRKVLKSSSMFTLEITSIYELMGKYENALQEYFNLIDENIQEVFTVQNRLQSLLLKDEDGKIYEIIRINTLKQTQKNPDKLSYSLLLMWLSIQNLDFETALFQAKAIDKRFKENGDRVFDLAKICTENKRWDDAINAYQYVLSKGINNNLYILAQVEILKVKFLKIIETYPINQTVIRLIDKEYSKTIHEIGFNPGISDLIRNQAYINAFYLNQDQIAIKLLDSLIAYPGLNQREKDVAKLELADILLFNNEIWDAVLLYAQVEKDFPNDTLGQSAKLKNAKLSFYIGEFEWSKAQLDVLRAATSKLIANDAMQLFFTIEDNLDEDDSLNLALQLYAKADLLLFKNKDDDALLTLDSIFTLGLYNSLFDEVLYKKAQIYVRRGQYIIADSLLKKMISFYPEELFTDDALFFRAEIQHYYLKDKNKAMDLYQELITTFPGSLLSYEARKRFRLLRGDTPNDPIN